MWKVLLTVSLIPLALSIIARWWFGLRVLADEGQRLCRCDLEVWLPEPGDDAVIHRAEAPAAEFGRQLRLKALAAWAERDPKSAAARENNRRFGMAVPPLSGIVAVMAVLVAKIPIIGAAAVVLTATALSCALGLLSLGPELQAIALAVRQARERRIFPKGDDHDAVARSAIAHAWKETLPPVIALFQR